MQGTAWFDNRFARVPALMPGPMLGIVGYLWAAWSTDGADSVTGGGDGLALASHVGPFALVLAGVLASLVGALAVGRGMPWPLVRLLWGHVGALAIAIAAAGLVAMFA